MNYLRGIDVFWPGLWLGTQVALGQESGGTGALPLWLKISYTLFVCVVVRVYWTEYGPGNFFWFSDIALLTTVLALWFESSLLVSMMALATFLFDIAWNIDFFVRLVSGRFLVRLSPYMFNHTIPLPIRALSLFHIFFPVLLLWMLSVLGYDERAFVAQTLLAWIVLPLTYLLTKRSENINWVHGLGDKPQTRMPPLLYLALLMILFPVLIYLPTHLFLKKIFG
jgi:hypothetical protein